MVLVALAYTACRVDGRHIIHFTWPSLVITTGAVTDVASTLHAGGPARLAVRGDLLCEESRLCVGSTRVNAYSDWQWQPMAPSWDEREVPGAACASAALSSGHGVRTVA